MTEPAESGQSPDHEHRLRHEAAAEVDTVAEKVEAITDKVRAGLAQRTGKMIAGFIVIALGIALLPIPVMGPAWILIIFGLTLLPFKWAQTATRFIRRHIPGIPEDGKIPMKSWVVMGAVIVVFVTLTAVFGPKLVTLVKGWL